jgi:hypothetical protein
MQLHRQPGGPGVRVPGYMESVPPDLGNTSPAVVSRINTEHHSAVVV